MRTPKEYTENLKNKIITEQMLSDALYSVNKRAKNWRDKKREYRSYYTDKYYNSAWRQENRMYGKKETLLSIVPVECIHREHGGCNKIRTYDYQKDFLKKYTNAYLRDAIVWENSYLDYNTYDEVWFFDVLDVSHPIFRYYLYQTVYGRGFHTPIDKADLKKYNYPIVDIDFLLTTGRETDNLLSVQFADKIIALIEAGDYTYVPAENPPDVGKKKSEIAGIPEYSLIGRYEFLEFWRDNEETFLERGKAKVSSCINPSDVVLSKEEEDKIRRQMTSVLESTRSTNKKGLQKDFSGAIDRLYPALPVSADPEFVYEYLSERYTANADLYALIIEAVTDYIKQYCTDDFAREARAKRQRMFARGVAYELLREVYPQKSKKKRHKKNADTK